MNRTRIGLLSLALGALAICARPASAQAPGSKVPTDIVQALQGFSQTPAKTFDEFVGRAVLIEFFAYW
jgi:hypothetical protein